MTLDIEQYVKQQLEDIDLTSHVRAVIKQELAGNIQTILKDEIREQAGSYVEAQIQKILEEGITISDGFTKEIWKSYADFFQYYLKEKLKSYDIKRTIKSTVEKRVNDLFSKELTNVINKIADELIQIVKEKGA